MKIEPVKGTSDYLSKEVALREFMQNSILETYKRNGFERIMTPALEDIENLDKSDGGENLNLIFKILKRGEKLSRAINHSQFDALADMGLRYDLTLPLSRYYANKRQHLILPFKCIQLDKVYRAEKPQKGRMRELVQCDIDIVGSESITCEIELIHVTATALLDLGLKNFTVRINDRRVLQSLLLSLGFREAELAGTCIVLDKLDKIGVGGIVKELFDKGLSPKASEALAVLLNRLPLSLDDVQSMVEPTEAVKGLEEIIRAVALLSENKYQIAFDLSLVRGQGYYTGTVFEIESKDFNSSIAGGGRYDNLIGKFINEEIPAVGFSIGFERIFSILLDNGFIIPDARKKIAVFYEEQYTEAYRQAENLRYCYDVALFQKPKKLNRFLNRLQEKGYYGFLIYGQSDEIKVLEGY